MRITGGKAAGVRLQTPRKGPEVRPATDRMREAVFSNIGSGVIGSKVLDLFAGTGAYGLEALSRGASAVTWVESSRRVAGILESNRQAVRKSMGSPQSAEHVIVRDFRRHGIPSNRQFDFIFADPPYNLAEDLLTDLMAFADNYLFPSGTFLLECRGDLPLPIQEWTEVRRFGNEKSGPSLRVLKRCND
ncbi:MAG: RsmD family RNA methyltransferase [Verrucomicrobiota bacterium]